MRWSETKLINSLLLLTLITSSHGQIKNFGSGIDSKNYSPGKETVQFLSNPLRQIMSDYDVIHYDIELRVNPDDQQIKGFTRIVLAPVVNIEDFVRFDFAQLQLDSVSVNGQRVEFSREYDFLNVYVSKTMMAGDTHSVSVYYQGKPKKGLYFRNNIYDDTIVYSHNEPYDAHYWFPCKDLPEDKATLSMSVLAPESVVALSNGKLMTKKIIGAGQILFNWSESYPIATYLISLTIGPFSIVRDEFQGKSGILPLAYWVYPEDLDRGIKALSQTKDMLSFFSMYIGEYPFFLDKYDMVEVPFKEAAAMENQTATTMGDFVMDDEAVIAHELAHQWWGDALTPFSFKDIWLNEGFASYFDALFTEFKYGKEAFRRQMDMYKSSMNTDGSLSYPIYDPPEEHLFGNAVYMKGAWVLHMLRNIVGDSVFTKILRNYYKDYKYFNVRTEDLIKITEQAGCPAGSEFFNQWLRYGGMPIIIADWQQTKEKVLISLDQYQMNPVYQLDIEVKIIGVFRDSTIIIPLREKLSENEIDFGDKVKEIIIDPENKVLNTNNSPLYYIPKVTKLQNIYPNPSRNRVNIVYEVNRNERVELLVIDLLGQVVSKLVDEKKSPGVYQVEWKGEDVASGIYFCLLRNTEILDTKKMVIIR